MTSQTEAKGSCRRSLSTRSITRGNRPRTSPSYSMIPVGGPPSRPRLKRARRPAVWVIFATLLIGIGASLPTAHAQLDFDREPIRYRASAPTDRVARLQAELQAGHTTLAFDPRMGYLPALLEALNISPTSQVLVFSKTSFQRTRINPERPRALYFSDDVYVGAVDGGDVIEISTADPQLGAVFYTLSQQPGDNPSPVRQLDNCLQCHVSSATEDVPGHDLRSVFPDERGRVILNATSFHTTYHSPLRERWGGWYVTGQHGQQRHLGNTLFRKPVDPEKIDYESGANVRDLNGRFDPSRCLTPHSDIVALMVLEHQIPLHNQIAAANYRARVALREQQALNEMLGAAASEISPGIQRRLERAADDVLQGLLLVGEAPLEDRIQGTAGFAEHFEALGPRDRHGRSLRELDLRTRLFKYPCSYLIYGEPLNALPAPVLGHLFQRLGKILSGEDADPDFAHLTPADRQAIYEILVDTKPDLLAHWKSADGA